MDISLTTVLDRGAKYQGNNPDNLTRRIALANLLVDARIVRTVEAAQLLFRIWAAPESHLKDAEGVRQYPVEALVALANQKAPR